MDDAGGLRSSASQRNGESLIPRESAACRNWNNERNTVTPLKRSGETINTGRVPAVRVPELGPGKQDKYRHA